jgi:hypothetical protein
MDEEVYIEPEKQLEKISKSEKALLQKRLSWLDKVLAIPGGDGMRYINWISNEEERWNETPMNSNSNWASFFKGKAEHAISIMKFIRTHRPEKYLEMQALLLSDQKEKEHERRNNG